MMEIASTRLISRFGFMVIFTVMIVLLANHHFAYSLPPVEDIPEEILRTEVITIARSPIDGKPLSAAEYAQLQAKIQNAPPPKLDSSIRETIFLIQLLRTLRTMFPFLNFF